MVMLLNVINSLQGDRAEEKRNGIISAVVDAIEQLCRCGYTAQYIDSSVSGFQCSSNHPSQVVFRSKLYGTADTTASEVTTHINQWISSDVSIVILGLILDIDPTCPVQISSFSDPECLVATSPPPGTGATSSAGATAAGVVVLIATITIAAVVVVIVVIIMRRRRGSWNPRDLNAR